MIYYWFYWFIYYRILFALPHSHSHPSLHTSFIHISLFKQNLRTFIKLMLHPCKMVLGVVRCVVIGYECQSGMVVMLPSLFKNVPFYVPCCSSLLFHTNVFSFGVDKLYPGDKWALDVTFCVDNKHCDCGDSMALKSCKHYT